MRTLFDVIVIGGGQAGLAAGYQLQRAGLEFAILEAGARPEGSWPGYYDSLRLFSPAGRSALPGLPFPADPDHYPHRDQVAAYLRGYAAHFSLPMIAGARVVWVERADAVFRVHTADAAVYQSRAVIAATGAFHRPFLPELPGQAGYQGRILHAAAYQSPEAFRGQRVLVVGAGNSAIQIGVELAQVADVTLATRAPIQFRRQRIFGRDVHHWAWRLGLDRLPLGAYLARRVGRGVLDTGVYQAAIAAGRPDRRSMFARFTPTGIAWAAGAAETVDAVIFATGYRPNLDYLAGLGALDADGNALHRCGVSTAVAGLGYVGLEFQRTYASATLRGVGHDAAYVVARLRRQLDAARIRRGGIACCAWPGGWRAEE
jgi:putative flavoprotein involved in K+ transport